MPLTFAAVIGYPVALARACGAALDGGVVRRGTARGRAGAAAAAYRLGRDRWVLRGVSGSRAPGLGSDVIPLLVGHDLDGAAAAVEDGDRAAADSGGDQAGDGLACSEAGGGTGRPGLAAYCQDLVNLQAPFLAANAGVLATAAAPVPAAGTNLLTFLASRLSASFEGGPVAT